MNIIIIILISLINLINISLCNNTDIKNINEYNDIVPNIIKNVIPSIVNVYVEINKKPNINKKIKIFLNKKILNKRYFNGLGSGVIIDSKKGYIITNYHVVNNTNIIKIQLYNKDELDAKILDYNSEIDLALLKIISPFKNLLEIKISDSENIKIGDKVIAIGNPFGLGQTVTYGIISALNRYGINPNGIENFIQTDASINKGNSGGALINMNGELIGINTAILSPTGGNIGIGFAIPSNIIKCIINQINNYGKIKKQNIGIYGINIDKYINKKYNLKINKGILVKKITDNSIAKKSGILKNDIIISINNNKINNFSEFKYKLFLLFSYKKEIKLQIIRNNINIDILLIFN